MTLRLKRERRNATSEDWNKVVFSDETRVGLASDGRVWVWRGPGERFHPDCIVSRNSCRKSIMYLRCITNNGHGDLLRCSNRMNSTEYLSILENAAIQATPDFDLVFMDDNAPIHRAQSVLQWKQDFNVTTLPWPAYSPDLNPIEEVWAYLKSRLNKLPKKIANLEDLHTAVTKIWNELSVSYIKKLYTSMPRRIKRCIANRGFPTKY